MYHAEKLIDGVLHWKSTPNAEWRPYTPEQLTKMLMKEREGSKQKSEVIESYQRSIEHSQPPLYMG